MFYFNDTLSRLHQAEYANLSKYALPDLQMHTSPAKHMINKTEAKDTKGHSNSIIENELTTQWRKMKYEKKTNNSRKHTT